MFILLEEQHLPCVKTIVQKTDETWNRGKVLTDTSNPGEIFT